MEGESAAQGLLVIVGSQEPTPGEVGGPCLLPAQGYPGLPIRGWLLSAAILLAACLWGPPTPWRGL